MPMFSSVKCISVPLSMFVMGLYPQLPYGQLRVGTLHRHHTAIARWLVLSGVIISEYGYGLPLMPQGMIIV